MPYPNQMPAPTAGLTSLAQEVLPVLYQHRLVATRQLHQLVQPHASTAVYLRRQLTKLREFGLANSTLRRRGGQGELLWYVTPLGMEVVEADREVTARAYRISPEAAASQLQEHTLAVVDTGLAFVWWARALGHECGPLDWDPEVAHRIRDGESRAGDEAVLVPDSVLSYVQHEAEQRTLLTFFVELDRATMPVTRLAAKLHSYARYLNFAPAESTSRGGKRREAGSSRAAWRGRYAVFPRLLIVLAGAGEQRLANRRADLRALVDADPRLQHAGSHLAAGVTTLEQLRKRGPFAPIVTPLFGGSSPADVLLRPRPVEEARI